MYPTDDSSPQLLFKLVCHLLHLSKSTNEGLAQDSGRCLGEIGAVHLGVVAIGGSTASPALSAAVQQFKGQSTMQRNCHIFHLLDSYLVDHRSVLTNQMNNRLVQAYQFICYLSLTR